MQCELQNLLALGALHIKRSVKATNGQSRRGVFDFMKHCHMQEYMVIPGSTVLWEQHGVQTFCGHSCAALCLSLLPLAHHASGSARPIGQRPALALSRAICKISISHFTILALLNLSNAAHTLPGVRYRSYSRAYHVGPCRAHLSMRSGSLAATSCSADTPLMSRVSMVACHASKGVLPRLAACA